MTDLGTLVIFMIVVAYWVTVGFAIPPIGKRFFNSHITKTTSKSRICHAEFTDDTPKWCREATTWINDCTRYHAKDCWRHDTELIPRSRNMANGFKVVALAFIWPVVVLPYIAITFSPESDSERAARLEKEALERDADIARLNTEIKRLEKQSKS
jgi:hypothetical protein